MQIKVKFQHLGIINSKLLASVALGNQMKIFKIACLEDYHQNVEWVDLISEKLSQFEIGNFNKLMITCKKLKINFLKSKTLMKVATCNNLKEEWVSTLVVSLKEMITQMRLNSLYKLEIIRLLNNLHKLEEVEIWMPIDKKCSK